MTKIVRALPAVLMALSLLLMLPLPAAAAGLGVGPPSVHIADASAGEEYLASVLVYNLGDSEETISVSASGDISACVSFHAAEDWTTPIDSISIPANDRKPLVLKFSLPADTVIGTYTGTVILVTAASEAEAGTVGLKFEATVDVIIDVEEGALPGEGTPLVGEESDVPAPRQRTAPRGGPTTGMTIGIAAGAMLAGLGIAALLFRRGRRRSQP